jgi:uncharacterized protein Usg
MDQGFAQQIAGFRRRRRGSLYRLPDHPRLQGHVWQDHDLAPRFPKLRDVLEFWDANLDGCSTGVRAAHLKLISPTAFAFVEGELRLQ